MKYVNANLQSYKEFIQRMLNGEVFYHDADNNISYAFKVDGFIITSNNSNMYINPCGIGYGGLRIKIEETIEEAIAVKPRLCWCSGQKDFKPKFVVIIVGKKGDYFEDMYGNVWSFAKLVELNEIKQYLGDDNE